MHLRDHILAEIRRLAAQTGQAPGQTIFARETGIAHHQWRGKFWARWGDALNDAGYGPNAWTQRLEADQVLLRIVEACRYYGRLPTQAEFELYRQKDKSLPSHGTIKNHFGTRSGLLEALLKLIESNEIYSDVRTMLAGMPRTQTKEATNKGELSEGFVYLIKSGDFCKIGRSDDIERRVKEIRIALPDKAALVHSIRTDDPSGIEAYWHNRFAAKRANGEWFKLSSADISAFRRRKYQ